MYWTILVNQQGGEVIKKETLEARWGDEASFKLSGHGRLINALTNKPYLVKITVYNVQPLWHKNNGRGGEDERQAVDVIEDIKDHLYYCGHDVISSQLDHGVP